MIFLQRIIVLFGIVISTAHLVSTTSIFDFPTEPPDLVEVFNPENWNVDTELRPQVQILQMKLDTRIKLRYGRTAISLSLTNLHDQQLQSNFRIVLSEDAFFTIFKIKRKNDRKFYSANVMKIDSAQEIFNFANANNGSITAGYIELVNDKDPSLRSYNLKFTIGPQTSIETFLLYERQIYRRDGIYRDKIHIYPIENSTIGFLELSVNVEEMENLTSLRCAPETEERYPNCEEDVTFHNGAKNKADMISRNLNVTSSFLKAHPFEFEYELDKPNSTSAVVITEDNGNLYFVHLFVPPKLPLTSKHIIFLLDVSDSMHGKKLDQLKESMTEILDDISEEDFFTIIEFSQSVSVFSPFNGQRAKCMFPMTGAHRKSANTYIQQLTAQGVTNIEKGMLKAFEVIQLFSPDSPDHCDKINIPVKLAAKMPSLKLPENVESMILFLSDGVATTGLRDPSLLLSEITSINQNLSKPAQIHSIAYGDSADVNFLKALSSQNGGTLKVIHNYSAAGIELTNFYLEVSSQVLNQIQTFVTLNGSTMTSSENQKDSYVVQGAEIVRTGKLYSRRNEMPSPSQQPLGNLRWYTEASSKIGRLAYPSRIYDCRSLNTSLTQCLEKIDFFLLRLQAYQLLKKWLYRDSLVETDYMCPKSYNDEDTIYSDTLSDGTETDCVNPYKEKITELALKFNFVTPYTAFILTTQREVDIGLLGKFDYYNYKHTGNPKASDRRLESEEISDPYSMSHNPIPDELRFEPLPTAEKRLPTNSSLNMVTNNATDNNKKKTAKIAVLFELLYQAFKRNKA